MAIFRANKARDYTVMSNRHLFDREISLEAKGLLTLMLSLPDGMSFSVDALIALCGESKATIEAALKELKEHGYLLVD